MSVVTRAFDRVPNADRLRAVLAGVAAITAVLLTVATLNIRSVAGCVFADGESYCAVARGELAHEPFNRRPLLPLLVRLFHPGGIISGFQFWSLLSLGFLAAGVAALTASLTATVAARRNDRAAPLIGASLVLLMPHGIRLAWVYPVFTDITAMALGVLWLVVLASRRPAFAPMVALMAVLCREQWAAPVLLVAIWLILRRQHAIGWAHVAAAVLGAVVDLTRPHTGVSYSTTLQRSASNFVHQVGPWSLIVIVGVLGVLYLTSRPWNERVGPREMPLLIVAVFNVCLGLIAGSDVPRLLAAGVPFLVCLALAWSSRPNLGQIRLVITVLSLFILWRVWQLPSAQLYRELFKPFDLPGTDLRVAADIFLALIVMAFLFWTRTKADQRAVTRTRRRKWSQAAQSRRSQSD